MNEENGWIFEQIIDIFLRSFYQDSGVHPLEKHTKGKSQTGPDFEQKIIIISD